MKFTKNYFKFRRFFRLDNLINLRLKYKFMIKIETFLPPYFDHLNNQNMQPMDQDIDDSPRSISHSFSIYLSMTYKGDE